MTYEIRRAQERYLTRVPGIETRHSFSYGDHYDAANTGFGPLRAVNEERLAPGAGYDAHRHEDVDIVTWVLRGELSHADTAGNAGTIRPGEVQWLSAGSGVEHTERNAGEGELVFVQMMLAPDPESLAGPAPAPAYVLHRVDARGLAHALHLRDGADLLVAGLAEGEVVSLPLGRVHLHVTSGCVRLGDATLEPGDCARIEESEGPTVTAPVPSECLIWCFGGNP